MQIIKKYQVPTLGRTVGRSVDEELLVEKKSPHNIDQMEWPKYKEEQLKKKKKKARSTTEVKRKGRSVCCAHCKQSSIEIHTVYCTHTLNCACISRLLFSFVSHSPTLKHTVALFFSCFSSLLYRRQVCGLSFVTVTVIVTCSRFFSLLFSFLRSNNVTTNEVRWCVHAQHIRSHLICVHVFVYKFENALPFKMLHHCFSLGCCYYCCYFVLLMRLRTSTHLRTLVHAHTISYVLRTQHTTHNEAKILTPLTHYKQALKYTQTAAAAATARISSNNNVANISMAVSSRSLSLST